MAVSTHLDQLKLIVSHLWNHRQLEKTKKKNEALRIAETNPYLSILAKVTFLGMVNSDSFTAEKSPGTWKTVTVNVAPPLETPGRWYTIST